jgi:beta-lactamase regulating signal transducer with metallopeptidase domain
VDHLLNWLWQGSVVGLATFAALRLLRRARAGSRYGLCSLALLTVVMLPAMSFVSVASPTTASAVEAAPSTAPLVPVPAVWWTSGATLGILWAVWCAASVTRLAVAVVAVRRARQVAQPLPATLESRLTFWTAVRNAGRPAQLVISRGVPSAAVLGWGSPVIALSPAFVERLPDEAIDRAVVHEWAHVQRRDDLLNALQVAILAIAGWHPAVWWLERQMRIERESACDEIAVRVTGSAKRYADSLTTMAELLPIHHRPASAVGVFSSPTLSARVPRILSIAMLRTARWSAATVLVVVALLSVLAVGVAQVRVFASSIAETVASVMHPVARVQPRLAPVAPPSAAPNRQNEQPKHAPLPQKPSSSPEPSVPSTPIVPVDTTSLATLPASAAPDDHISALEVPQPASTPTGVAPSPPPPPSPAARTSAPPDDAQTPWGAAADAGTAVGRGSRKAGVATGSFFSRLGKKIAGSF